MINKWYPEELRKSINCLLDSTNPKHGGEVVGFLPTGGGQNPRGTQNFSAPANSLPVPAQAGGGGLCRIDTHGSIAPAKPSPVPAQAGGGGHGQIDTHEPHAPAKNGAEPSAERRSEPASPATTPTVAPPARPSLSVLADRQQAAAQRKLATICRLSKLDEVLVEWPGFKKPIGECTVGEVRRWIEIRKGDARAASRDVRFASVLIANLNSNVVLKDQWRNLDEVNRHYAEAEAEYAA
jgi:hypothetical protein